MGAVDTLRGLGHAAVVSGAGPTVLCLTTTEMADAVIAELEGRNDDNIVMAGAHLDSVEVGPGINDNGTGSAALLEIAQQMSKTRPENTVRLAWWGAEELGLIGSTEYVAALNVLRRMIDNLGGDSDLP